MWRFTADGMLQGSMVAGVDTTELLHNRSARLSGDALRVTTVTTKGGAVNLQFANLP